MPPQPPVILGLSAPVVKAKFDALVEGKQVKAWAARLPPEQDASRTGPTAAAGTEPLTYAKAYESANAEQRGVLDRMARCQDGFIEWVAADKPAAKRPEQQLHFIHGGPGAGKSYIIKAMRLRMAELRCHAIICANLASAAVLIGGRTIHSTAGLGDRIDEHYSHLSTNAQTRLATLHESELVWCIIIDEISAVGVKLFYNLDRRMRDLFGIESRPFGGIHVFVFGDFFQLQPPGDFCIFETLVKIAVHGATISAKAETNLNAAYVTDVFRMFTKTELLINERAKVRTVRVRPQRTPSNSAFQHLFAPHSWTPCTRS